MCSLETGKDYPKESHLPPTQAIRLQGKTTNLHISLSQQYISSILYNTSQVLPSSLYFHESCKFNSFSPWHCLTRPLSRKFTYYSISWRAASDSAGNKVFYIQEYVSHIFNQLPLYCGQFYIYILILLWSYDGSIFKELNIFTCIIYWFK